MTSVADFIKIPKCDFHNNLDLGMRYPSYIAWAGFYMPDFPEDGSIVKKDLRSQIKEYTRIRTGSEGDIHKLLSLSLSEASADNITEIYGTINFSLLNACDTPENFVSAIDKALKAYSDKIRINTVLAADTDFLNENSIALCSSLLGSGFFKGVYLYGKNLTASPQKYAAFIKEAKNHGLHSGINAEAAKSSSDFLNLLYTFSPDVILQGDYAAKDKEILNCMKKNGVGAVITPNPDEANTVCSFNEKAVFLRNFLEAGVPAKIGTESILLFNKSISQFAAELANTKIFTTDELISIMKP